jgi:hypothetical protein
MAPKDQVNRSKPTGRKYIDLEALQHQQMLAIGDANI